MADASGTDPSGTDPSGTGATRASAGLVTLAEIRRAADRVAGVAVRTPLLAFPAITDGWLKPECLQPVGSFKIRGATYALSRLEPADRARGVITHSSGNHGQALAYAGRALGVAVTVVMPDTAPAIKISATRQYGAEIVLVPPAERLERTEQLVAERGLVLVPPFDHRDVIAGQGTVGLEIIEERPDVAAVLVPVGGGGLASGVATAVKALAPRAAVIGVEPELAGDAAESLRAGERRTWPVERTYRTVADGLRTGLSALTFAHLRQRLDGIVTVTEDEILETTGALVRAARIVVEPSGAVAPAALRHHRADLPAGPVVAVVSGGNLEPAQLAALLA